MTTPTIPDHLREFTDPETTFTAAELAVIRAHESRISGVPDCFAQFDADVLDRHLHKSGPGLVLEDCQDLARDLDLWRESIRSTRAGLPANLTGAFALWLAAEHAAWTSSRERYLTAVAGHYLGRDENGLRYVSPLPDGELT